MATSVPSNSCSPCRQNSTTTGCPITVNGNCVFYTGQNIPSFGINGGDTFNSIVPKLLTSTVVTTNSATIHFTGNGSVGSPLSATLAISADPNNALSALPDGVFAAGLTLTAANNGVSMSAGSVVQLGNNIGAGTAVLLSNREIPSGGFNLCFTGAGKLLIGATSGDSTNILQVYGSSAVYGVLKLIGQSNVTQQVTTLHSTKTIANPFYQVQNSSAVPIFALNSETFYNTFIGVGVGVLNVWTGTEFGSGGSNVAMGYLSMTANTSGSVNTAVGNHSLGANTTGMNNCAFGANAALTNTTGHHNTAIGQAAMAFNTTGAGNTFIGHDSGRQNLTGDSNTALGRFSLMNNQTGANNVAVGLFSLAQPFETSIFNTVQNTAVGNLAGFALQAVGQNNILMGYNCNSSSNLGDNNIMIGANQICGTGLSNTTLIGQAMTTNLSNIVGLGRIDQNVIVGLTNPTVDNGGRLQVVGKTLTGSSINAAVYITQTWNTTGVVSAFILDATDTASNLGSMLLDIRNTGTPVFQVSKLGYCITIDPVSTDSWSFGPDISHNGRFSLQGDGPFCYNQKVKVGDLNLPTAQLHLTAGTALMAPFKLTSGPVLTVPEDGALEYDGTHLYFTIGATRHTIV